MSKIQKSNRYRNYVFVWEDEDCHKTGLPEIKRQAGDFRRYFCKFKNLSKAFKFADKHRCSWFNKAGKFGTNKWTTFQHKDFHLVEKKRFDKFKKEFLVASNA